MTDLTALIERLKAATEGSRELDYDIARSVGWTERVDAVDGKKWWANPDGIWGFVRPLTTSLDAALTLITPETDIDYLELYCDNGQWFVKAERLISGGNIVTLHRSEAGTDNPSLQVCIASLLARKAGG